MCGIVDEADCQICRSIQLRLPNPQPWAPLWTFRGAPPQTPPSPPSSKYWIPRANRGHCVMTSTGTSLVYIQNKIGDQQNLIAINQSNQQFWDVFLIERTE